MTSAASESVSIRSPLRLLLHATDAIAALLLIADLAVVIVSVTLRSLFTLPVEWSDDRYLGRAVAFSVRNSTAVNALSRSGPGQRLK